MGRLTPLKISFGSDWTHRLGDLGGEVANFRVLANSLKNMGRHAGAAATSTLEFCAENAVFRITAHGGIEYG